MSPAALAASPDVGGAVEDYLERNEGNDAVAGWDDNDVLDDGPGHDKLSGKEGADKIVPDVGNDRHR